jgi:hypothetical protein
MAIRELVGGHVQPLPPMEPLRVLTSPPTNTSVETTKGKVTPLPVINEIPGFRFEGVVGGKRVYERLSNYPKRLSPVESYTKILLAAQRVNLLNSAGERVIEVSLGAIHLTEQDRVDYRASFQRMANVAEPIRDEWFS